MDQNDTNLDGIKIVHNRLTGWEIARLGNNFAHPVNYSCPFPKIAHPVKYHTCIKIGMTNRHFRPNYVQN